MTGTLTTGNPWKKIIQFTLPLLLGNLFQQAYNMADAAIVGQTLGVNALGAVGATGSVQFLVLGFCMGTSSGFAIPVANAYGAKRWDRLKRNVFTGGFLCIILAVVITSLSAYATPQILQALQVPEILYQDTYIYLLILFLGIPFTLLYNYLSALLRAIGDSKTPFYFLALSSVINILLDLFFILTLCWGVAGAAIATIIAQALSGFLCLYLIYRKFPILHLQKEYNVLEKDTIHYLLNMGLPMGIQFSITAIGSMVMQSANNALGTAYVSGFAAASKINSFFMSPFDALANAVCTFASQNYGALQAKRIQKGIHIGILLSLAWGMIGGAILIFVGRPLSALFMAQKGSELASIYAGKYLRALGYFYTLLGILIVTRLLTQGLGMSKRAVLAGAFEMVARISVSILAVPKLGFFAICFADQAAWLAADLYILPTCYYAYQKVKNDIQRRTEKKDIY